MLTVDQYGDIRRAHRDGMSLRDIARTFHHSRRKVRPILAEAQPRPYTRAKPPPAPVLGAFHAAIDALRADDEQAPPKQRHTAMQVYRRLRDEHGYAGGYDQVRRYVGKHRRDGRETFIPLAHDPGQRLECDFGHIHVDFPAGRRPVPVFVSAWSYSNYPFVMAMPTERTEAILAGLVEAFAFFGCAPHAVWWDNPTTVVRQIFRGRDRRPSARYAALASHYAFDPLFCMPARGNAKPSAETRVRVVQRQWATPVPRADGLPALNAYFRARRRRGRSHRRRLRGVDRPALRSRPGRGPGLAATAVRRLRRASGAGGQYQVVRFDHNRYRVPRACAYRAVTVKGYIDRAEVVDGGQVVARHGRSYGRDGQVPEPLHYLAALGRRPAALDHAPVLRDGQLPESFARLRQALEGRHGPTAGARHYIRVLQLLAEHPLGRVPQAVEGCRRRDELHAERIGAWARRLAGPDGAGPAPK